MSNKTTTTNSTELVKLYQSIDEEGVIKSKYKYLLGSPKNYRFDGRTGDFNLGGVKPIGKKLVIQPIAFRFMEDALFARKDDTTKEFKREQWCEIFFIDESKAVSYLMLNNSSARNLSKLIESLFYEDLELTDLVLTIDSEKKENAKGKYFVTKFEFTIASPESIEEYRQLCEDIQIFCRDTIQDTAVLGLCSNSYPVNMLPVAPNQPLVEA